MGDYIFSTSRYENLGDRIVTTSPLENAVQGDSPEAIRREINLQDYIDQLC